MTQVLVCAGGDLTAITARDLPDVDVVIAADSGVHHAHALGFRVDEVVGDLDSVHAVELQWALASGAELETHPADKDFTDFEAALHRAMTHTPETIMVIGWSGGRMDHLLGNLTVLTHPDFASATVTAIDDQTIVTVIHREATLDATESQLVSLLAMNGSARGVTTEGLRWGLRDDVLESAVGRGVSNEFVETTATVSVQSGVLLAVQPRYAG